MTTTSVTPKNNQVQNAKVTERKPPLPSLEFNQSSSKNFEKNKEELTQEILDYKKAKTRELSWSRQLNRWSIGIALALSTASTVSAAYDNAKEYTMLFGTLSVTFHSWIATFPMSKKVALYERTLVKSDNLRSDLKYAAQTESDLAEIRESFKILKVEFIQENPQEQIHSLKSLSSHSKKS